MDRQEILIDTADYVKKILENESSGHDWWHIERVRKTALLIGKRENADLFTIEMAALLHDVADEKLNMSEEEGLHKVRIWLSNKNVSNKEEIIEIISTMSFKGGNRPPMKTLEGMIVQDADRLDAIGAIGIARTFAYAGAHGDLIYDPAIPYREQMTKDEYRNGKSTAINHFYEKLLKLSNNLNTKAAKELANSRHEFMQDFLNQFYKEWNGLG
ncbi:HD domain-containing protein [Ferdinandcohnia quinoae]|uniref:HD domain-containing protein n=1 Tax=Fredinandcohnia quinoae TaxID=2918902 RepID=A0AAW5EDX7_9BACI|nr:HD domain-containing protein [Fredinandcohnia sp. SECRCQ15]MCH1627363.1 HD domain-containing protein [Fredinandcohnia sp. SECRCQ15]